MLFILKLAYRAAVIFFSALSLCTGGAVWGFNTIDPEPGMWGIADELNGQPGRGLQIDNQGGDLFIITYIGYRADGSAIFFQTSGELFNNSFSGQLSEYKNGRVLGGPARSGEAAAIIGAVSIAFDSSSTGRITLPGEPEKSITRLQFYNVAERFNQWDWYFGTMTINSFLAPSPQRFKFNISSSSFELARTQSGTLESCTFNGIYSLSGKGLNSTGKYTCLNGSTIVQTGNYTATGLTVNRQGVYSGSVEKVSDGQSSSIEIEHHHGICYGGTAGLSYRCLPQ